MTTAEMLTRLRAQLDEESEFIYKTTADLYPALTEAELEVARTLAVNYKQMTLVSNKPIKVPKTILPLLATPNGTVTVVGQKQDTLATAPIEALRFRYNPDGALGATGEEVGIEIGNDTLSKQYILHPELSDGVYYWYDTSNVYWNPPSTVDTAEWELTIIKYPQGITASLEPEIDEVAHDAVIERALWILMKDREADIAQIHLQLYGEMLGGLSK